MSGQEATKSAEGGAVAQNTLQKVQETLEISRL